MAVNGTTLLPQMDIYKSLLDHEGKTSNRVYHPLKKVSDSYLTRRSNTKPSTAPTSGPIRMSTTNWAYRR